LETVDGKVLIKSWNPYDSSRRQFPQCCNPTSSVPCSMVMVSQEFLDEVVNSGKELTKFISTDVKVLLEVFFDASINTLGGKVTDDAGNIYYLEAPSKDTEESFACKRGSRGKSHLVYTLTFLESINTVRSGAGFEEELEDDPPTAILESDEAALYGRSLATSPKMMWPRAVVPYVFQQASWNVKKVFEKVFSMLEEDAYVRFVERKKELTYMKIIHACKSNSCPNKIKIHDFYNIGDGQGKKIELLRKNLNVNNPKHVADVVRVLLHALGLKLTHNRQDRDDHVVVNLDNIELSDQSKFTKCSDCEDYGVAYDCMSILHYRGNQFAREGTMSLMALDPGKCDLNTANIVMRWSDLDAINARYGHHCPVSIHSGTIKSHEGYHPTKYGPSYEYPKNYVLSKYLQVREGNNIEMVFNRKFKIEGPSPKCPYDWIRIYDGNGEELLSKTCGFKAPGKILSKTNRVHIIFLSDKSGAKEGWKLEWTELDKNSLWTTWTEWTECTDIDTESYRIRTCDMPGPDAVGSECNGPTFESKKCSCFWYDWGGWGVCDQSSGTQERERLCQEYDGCSCEGEDRQLQQCNVDGGWGEWGCYSECVEGQKIRERECNNPTPKFLGKDCEGLPVELVPCNSGKEIECSGLIMNISSPNFPQNYDNNFENKYPIAVQENQVINLWFTHFQLPTVEDNENCNFDFVQILGENDEPISEKICGEEKRTFLTSLTEVSVLFHTDNRATHSGWQLQWCPDSVVTSPNYPSKYGNNVEKTTRIGVGKGNKVGVEITDMEIEYHATCDFDYLMIKDGDGSILLEKTCGTNVPSHDILSNTEDVYVTFVSDSMNTRRGFQLRWTEVSIN